MLRIGSGYRLERLKSFLRWLMKIWSEPNDDKTSAVHFLRFQLGASQVSTVKDGAAITFGIDHKNYQEQAVLVSEGVRTVSHGRPGLRNYYGRLPGDDSPVIP